MVNACIAEAGHSEVANLAVYSHMDMGATILEQLGIGVHTSTLIDHMSEINLFDKCVKFSYCAIIR